MDQISELSPKQINYMQNSDRRINLSEGAVRSGKTISTNLRWLEYVVHSAPPGEYLMVGKTERTLKRNVLTPMKNLLGEALKINQGQSEVSLCNKKIYLAGASDKRAEGKIRGLTLAGAYTDEVSLYPESFFQMLLSRLSVTGSKLFGTTNPEGPYHWLKKGVIDRRFELDMSLHHFNIEDNIFLDPDYVKNLKAEYTGVFYQRYIEGLWVLAEGIIYDVFDENTHTDHIIGGDDFDNYIIGVDYGTSNPCTFGMFGFDKTLPAYLIKEYFYDGGKEGNKQKTDRQYANDLIKFIGDKKIDCIYVDPAALSFITELKQMGLPVRSAKNDVLPGIKYVSGLLSTGGYYIDSDCRHTIEGYQSYVWDSKAQERGEDKPLKKNDHTCFAAGTMIDIKQGDSIKLIEDIEAGDYVLTRNGYRIVESTMCRQAYVSEYIINGRNVTVTPDHPFFTSNRGWVPVSELRIGDVLLTPGWHILISRLEYKPLHAMPVYNITVKDDHEYFANGILVSNCDRDRYALFSHFFKRFVKTGQKHYK